MKLAAIPYESEVDILLIDEFGNTIVWEENRTIFKNEETYIPIKN